MNKFGKLKEYAYYIIIGVISFISVAFLPMLNSEINVAYKLPQTRAAWFLWAGTRIAVSVLNVMIFHCFVKQGDLNTRNSESRQQAEEILKIDKKEKIRLAKSPKKFFSEEYIKKIPTILLTTALSLLSFAPAVMSFDMVTFTTYLFTCIIAVIFGIIEMFKIEDYYNKEYLLYAKRRQIEIAEEEKKEKENESQRAEIAKELQKSVLKFDGFKFLGKGD